MPLSSGTSSVGTNVRTNASVLVGQELRPPAADLVEHDPDRVVGRREAVDRPRVPVAEDDRAAELPDAVEALVRLRPEADVAEADDPVDLLLLEVGEDGVEREQVAVDVRDEADAHLPSLRGPGAY